VSVEFVHRLRFTRGALETQNPLLAETIAAGGPGPGRLMAFVDSGVAAEWPDLAARLEAYAAAHEGSIDLACAAIEVPGGERAKNDHSIFESAAAEIDRARICRQSYVLVIGGGAVLDAIGFAAATVHRGVRLIRMPTTTLAQADGGLGVKNGVNAFGKKNLLGTFAVPWAVINDGAFLETLSDRDFRCGFSEVVKVALLKDARLFMEMASRARRVAARDASAAASLLRRSAELHFDHIVSGGDPFELRASRPLDFGHWSAHKLEQMSDFEIRHGEAVAIGVALDVVHSALLGWLAWPAAESILSCLEHLGFRLWCEELLETSTLLEGLQEFREHLGGELTITLLRGIGEPRDVHELDGALVRSAVERLSQRAGAGPAAAAG
jgi:3-dehydroquinate synthase